MTLYIYIYIYCGRNKSFPNQVLFSLEMTLSLSPQRFAQSHIGEKRLSLMPYKPWPKDESIFDLKKYIDQGE